MCNPSFAGSPRARKGTSWSLWKRWELGFQGSLWGYLRFSNTREAWGGLDSRKTPQRPSAELLASYIATANVKCYHLWGITLRIALLYVR